MSVYKCAHCGNEYQGKKEQCPTCGSRKVIEMAPIGFLILDSNDEFRVLKKPMPFEEIAKIQKPPPKPLPPMRRLQAVDEPSLIYKPYDDGIGWVGKLWLAMIIVIVILMGFYFGGCSIHIV